MWKTPRVVLLTLDCVIIMQSWIILDWFILFLEAIRRLLFGFCKLIAESFQRVKGAENLGPSGEFHGWVLHGKAVILLMDRFSFFIDISVSERGKSAGIGYVTVLSLFFCLIRRVSVLYLWLAIANRLYLYTVQIMEELKNW